MNLLFRLLWMFLSSPRRPAAPTLGPVSTAFRCLPTDLDIYRHMTNSRYLAILDLARLDLMLRTGLGKGFAAQGWYPVVAAETIRFRKSLKLFDAFSVETCILGWDEKAFILQQRFIKGGECIADALIRGRILSRKGGAVPLRRVLDLAGVPAESPALPPWVQEWNRQQAA
jgi:acyl-CoA thioesterase FadM